MSILDPPDWLKEYVTKWQGLLHLDHWRIKVILALAPGDSTNTLAICSQVQNVSSATLTFRADVEKNQDWEETALHEILHVMHGHVDQMVWEVVCDGMSESDRSVSYRAYSAAMEKFVDGLSKVVWKLEHPESLQETNHDKQPFGFLPRKSRPLPGGSGTSSD